MSSNRSTFCPNPTCMMMVGLLLTGQLAVAEEGAVRVAEEKVVLPTYEIGPADPNPMFYTNESYQGAQKRIYPYALQDHLTHAKVAKEHTSLVLENDFLELSVLPEIGGRLFSAVDKTNGYDFFYRQHVIKPALIGMLGAWISGGVEWCAFHHHRNTTYMPIEFKPVEELPAKVEPPAKPEDVNSIEELYLTGLRVEQIHNPTVDPLAYYREALERDPGDSRCNTMLGMHANKKGLYAEAEKHLRTAIERVSAQYTRPKNVEAVYQLGIALRGQHQDDRAYDAFYRATWDQAFHSGAYYQLAEISTSRGDHLQALDQVNRSLSTGALDTKALALKAGILRKLRRGQQAEKAATIALGIDPLDFRAINELRLAQELSGKADAAKATLDRMTRQMRGEAQSYLELAADYFAAGMWKDAAEDESADFFAKFGEQKTRKAQAATAHYVLGLGFLGQGKTVEAQEELQQASQMNLAHPWAAYHANATARK